MYALGSLTDLDGVPGVRDHTFSLKATGSRSVEDLRELLPKLDKQGGRMVVVGGGATGVEAAAEFAESYPGLHVTLATRGQVMPTFTGPATRAYPVSSRPAGCRRKGRYPHRGRYRQRAGQRRWLRDSL